MLEELLDGTYRLIYSSALLDELIDVLGRPRFHTKYRIEQQEVEALVGLIVLKGELVVSTQTIRACRDPKDDMVLEAAVAARADIIVSGDKDLLVLNPFEGIPIVGPAEFLARTKTR